MVRISESRVVVFLCDAESCRAQVTFQYEHVDQIENGLEPPWRAFVIEGWVGQFHACSDVHEHWVREHYGEPPKRP